MAKRIIVGFVALLCVAMVLGAVGCGSKNSKGNPEQTVKDFWSAMQKGDIEKAKTYLSKTSSTEVMEQFVEFDNPTTTAMMQAFMGAFDVKITGSNVNGDNATVDVELTYPDMDYALDKLFSGLGEDAANLSEEQMMEKLLEELPKIIKDAPSTTKTDQISLVWENDTWLINENPFAVLENSL